MVAGNDSRSQTYALQHPTNFGVLHVFTKCYIHHEGQQTSIPMAQIGKLPFSSAEIHAPLGHPRRPGSS